MTAERRTLLAVIGTRPELIKMAPVMSSFQGDLDFELKVCMTGQHRELIESVKDVFQFPCDFNLDLMSPGQTLWGFSGKCMQSLGAVIAECKPAGVIAQGDTCSTFIAALTSYYSRIPFFHVEAGLRSFDEQNPYPEEMNRVLTSQVAALHFAPTTLAQENLINEGVAPSRVILTGNTVVDALSEIRKTFIFNEVKDVQRRKILVTVHRREHFGEPLVQICDALEDIAARTDVEIVLPVHPNPNVREVIYARLAKLGNVQLLEPLSYTDLLKQIASSYFVLTDSGGIQEEAPSFGKPVLIMRKCTERMEAVNAGVARLVGWDRSTIVSECTALLDSTEYYSSMVAVSSPFGDGEAGTRIRSAIRSYLL